MGRWVPGLFFFALQGRPVDTDARRRFQRPRHGRQRRRRRRPRRRRDDRWRCHHGHVALHAVEITLRLHFKIKRGVKSRKLIG